MSPETPELRGHVPGPRTGRDRRHLFPGRPRAVNARFTDDEYAELAIAADLAGLTATGFCAQAALDAARDLHTNTAERVNHQALGDLQADLFRARVAVNQLRAELSRSIDLSNTGGRSSVMPTAIIAQATDSLADLDKVVSCVHQQLANRA
jgi:uncharacterized protein (DUF1778 family)